VKEAALLAWIAGDGWQQEPRPAASWVTHTCIDNSRHAVSIERLLERAIAHLPELIADTITEVSR